MRGTVVSFSMLLLLGCVGAPTRPGTAPPKNAAAGITEAPTSSASSSLPSATARVPIAWPRTNAVELSSGLHVVTVERAQPLLDVRLVVGSGAAADGERSGRAAVLSHLVAEAARTSRGPGDSRAITFDAAIDVDHVILGARILPDDLEPTLGALGAVLASPKVSAADIKRFVGEVSGDEARWLATLDGAGERLARRSLFVEPTSRHPFSVVHPSPEELARIDSRAVEELARTSWVAPNLTLVVVGSVGGIDVGQAAEMAFAHVATTHAPPLSLDDPMGRPRSRSLLLVDRPDHRPATITVGRLGPEMSEGEAVPLRLFGEVASARASTLVGRPRFRLVGYQDGPTLALFEVEVGNKGVKQALGSLLSPDLGRDVSDRELREARGVMSDLMAVALDRPGFLADALATRVARGGSPSSLERDLLEADTTGADAVTAAGRKLLAADDVIVVVGDAKTLGPELVGFADVDVLDPSRDLERARTLRRENAPETGGKLPSAGKTGDD